MRVYEPRDAPVAADDAAAGAYEFDDDASAGKLRSYNNCATPVKDEFQVKVEPKVSDVNEILMFSLFNQYRAPSTW